MQLIKALRYVRPASIAFVGAGGKTTAIFRAARELIAQNDEEDIKQTVLVTTSTHFGVWQSDLADHWFTITSNSDISRMHQAMPDGIVLLTGPKKGGRLSGLSMELLDGVHKLAEGHNLPLLIEADGAGMLPLKVPANHEPVVPSFVRLVVVVAGLGGLGKPLTDAWVHRAKVFAGLGKIKSGELVTVEALVKVLTSKKGGLKNIPEQARKIVLLNQADTPELRAQAKILAEKMISDYDSIIIATLQPTPSISTLEENGKGSDNGIHRVIERTAGIILAAGNSSRFGQPKQLLPWKGEPLIRHVTHTAIEAGLQPVVVVIGAYANEIELVINNPSLRIVNNRIWMHGMSSSVKAGLQALPNSTGAAVFLQADQPHIPVSLIEQLIELHQKSLHHIIAPLINGQRGNPVLFDAEIFPELLALEGDIGGRALFQQYSPEWLEWFDKRLLLDIDSPEDYQTLLLLYPESEVN